MSALLSSAGTAERQADVLRSIPGFVVWRWRSKDDRECFSGRHVYNQDCPEHGCPECYFDGGWDYLGCAKCDALMAEEYPDPDCRVGDDCPVCDKCPGEHQCACKIAVCRCCGLCKNHVQKVGGYRGRRGQGGYPVDVDGQPLDCHHSWRDPTTGLWS